MFLFTKREKGRRRISRPVSKPTKGGENRYHGGHKPSLGEETIEPGKPLTRLKWEPR